jgi:hypothetical protein
VGGCSVVNNPDDPVEPGATGGGGGSPPSCQTVDDCPDDGDNCTVATCDNGSCGVATTDPNDSDACTDDSCDGSGMPVNTAIDPNDMNDCTWDVCDPMVGPSNPDALVVFEDDFSGGVGSWTLTGPWQIGPARPSGVSIIAQNFARKLIARDPAADTSATADEMLAGVVIGGYANAAVVTPIDYLESPAVDATVMDGKLVLRYQRNLVSDYPPYMRNTVEVFDGTAWVTLFDTPPNIEWADTGWTEVSHDITMYANAQLKIRFGFGLTSMGAFVDMPSWSIDDVQILHYLVYEDDGDACTADLCDMGAPVHEPIMLDDANACTTDSCDPLRGVSHHDRSIRLLYDFTSTATGYFVLGPEWQVGAAVGIPSGDPGMDTTTVTDDNRIAGMIIGGNYTIALHPFSYISLPPFDATTPVGTLQLEYQRWLNSDYMPYVNNVVEVSNAAGFAVVWQSGPAPGIFDTAWTPQMFDITPLIGGNPTPIVRFGMGVFQTNAASSGGWNIDDITIRDLGCPMN